MWCYLDSMSRRYPELSANMLAAGAFGIGVLLLTLEFQPHPAGSDLVMISLKRPSPVTLQIPSPVKLPEVAPVSRPDEILTTDSSESVAAIGNAVAAQSPSQVALERKVSLLQKGLEHLKNVPDYTAQFYKQEMINDTLSDEQCMFMKVRHEPFSVYLKWLEGDRGREALYVDGQNDGKMLVKAGGWKSRLPTLSLDPEGSLAMGENRYPVTKAGILELTKMILAYHDRDLKTSNYTRCDCIESQMFGERECIGFVLEYSNPTVAEGYRKSITLIDKEWNVPLFIKNFNWPVDANGLSGEELDQSTLIEYYAFCDVKFASQLQTAEFDASNEEYKFRR